MTISNTIKSLALVVACSALNAQAGVAPAPAPLPSPSTSLWSGSVTLGYDTDYYFRGVRVYGSGSGYAEDLATAALDLNYQINDRLTWNLNAWYGNSVADHNYDEIDLHTKLLYKVSDTFSFGPSFTYYTYPYTTGGGSWDQYEFGLEGVLTPCANTTVGIRALYEIESEAFYAEINASYVWKLTDRISLVPGALVSYVDRDSSKWTPESSDFNHASLFLKAPIGLMDNVTLTPYVAANFPLDGVEDYNSSQDDEIYGGVSLSVGF
jgi:hypothetical protein